MDREQLDALVQAVGAVPLAVAAWVLMIAAAGAWLYRVPAGRSRRRPPAWLRAFQPRPSIRPLPRPLPPPPAAAAAGHLPPGAQAPYFALASLHGLTLTLDDLAGQGAPVVLVFVRPECGDCERILPDVGRWQHELSPRVVVMPISHDLAATQAAASSHGLVDVLLQGRDEIAAAYGVHWFPSGVLLQGGRVARAYAQGPEAIRALVEDAVRPAPSA